MKIRRGWMWAYLAVLALVGAAGTVASLSCSSNGSTGGGKLAEIEGSWSGTWTDTVYNVSGPASATFTKSGDTFNGTGTIGLASIGLGLVGGTATGASDGSTLTFSFTAPGFGNGNGTVSGSEGSGSGSVAGFGAFTFEGTVSGSKISGTFTFTSPGGGRGTVTLNRG